MNVIKMINDAKKNAPSEPVDLGIKKTDDLFLNTEDKHSISWNDSIFFAGNGKKISSWNLKDMLKFVEEQYALKFGSKPGFSARPAMMAMSGLRYEIEKYVDRHEVNISMKMYIEWHMSNIGKWWKGKIGFWHPQKLVSDFKIKEFFDKQISKKNNKEKIQIQKRPVNTIILEEFYRGDSSEFIMAYGIVIPVAFLIKNKNFSIEDASGFVIDAVKRAISSGSCNLSSILEINEMYRPFDRFDEINPEDLIMIVRNSITV